MLHTIPQRPIPCNIAGKGRRSAQWATNCHSYSKSNQWTEHKKHNQAQDRSDRFQQPSINHYLNAQAVLVLELLRKRQVVALLAHLTVDSSRFCSSADLYRIDVDLNESWRFQANSNSGFLLNLEPTRGKVSFLVVVLCSDYGTVCVFLTIETKKTRPRLLNQT